MTRHSHVIIAGAVVAITLAGGTILYIRSTSPTTSSETPRVVPPFETRVKILDTLGESGANTSTSVQTPEMKLRVLEAVSQQDASYKDAANSADSSGQSDVTASPVAPPPDTSAKLDVLQSMRGQ
ncbi:MAG: hypothetical protein AAB927_00725 [Patescibacteria group bacterium]